MLLRGVDLNGLPVGRAVNAVYALLTDGLPDQKRIELDMRLDMPLPGEVVNTADELWDHAGEDGALFLAAYRGQ